MEYGIFLQLSFFLENDLKIKSKKSRFFYYNFGEKCIQRRINLKYFLIKSFPWLL